MPAFGILPMSVGANPLYKLVNPVVFTVYRNPEIIPLYGRGVLDLPLVALSCSCVLIYSIGHTDVASTAPAMHPVANGRSLDRFFGCSARGAMIC